MSDHDVQSYVQLKAAAQTYATGLFPVPVDVRGIESGPGRADVEVVLTLDRERFTSLEPNGQHHTPWRWTCSGVTWSAALDGLLVEVAPFLSGEKPFPDIPDITPTRPVRIGNRYEHALEALGMALRELERVDPGTMVIEELRTRFRLQVAMALSKVPRAANCSTDGTIRPQPLDGGTVLG